MSGPYLAPFPYLEISRRLDLLPVTTYSHQCFICIGDLHLYNSRKDEVDIFFQPVSIFVAPKALEMPVIAPSCFSTKWSISYALYSGAFFSFHALQLPILTRFQFYMKIDADIEFYKRVPTNVFFSAFHRRCSIVHSAIQASTDCERDSVIALKAYSKAIKRDPLSIKYSWCNNEGNSTQVSKIFYGNFLGFSSSFLNNISDLAKWLYFEYPQGYFTNRWGDQAPWMIYACAALDIPNLYDDSKICDISVWRREYFHHR